MKISLYPQKISSIIKFILKGIPFNFQIWQRDCHSKNYSQIKSKEMDKRIAGVCLYLRLRNIASKDIIKSEIQVHAHRNILNSIRTKEEHVWRIKNQHNF